MLAAFSPLLIWSEAGVFIMSNILTFKREPLADWLSGICTVCVRVCECVTNLLCNLADPGWGAVGKVRASGAPTHWRLHALIGGYTCRDTQGDTDSHREKGLTTITFFSSSRLLLLRIENSWHGKKMDMILFFPSKLSVCKKTCLFTHPSSMRPPIFTLLWALFYSSTLGKKNKI